MAFPVIYLFLASFVILVSAQTDDFAEQVRSHLPDDVYEKIFAANINSNDAVGEVDKANVRAIRVFENVLGVPLEQSTIQQIRKHARRLAENLEITPELVFKAYTVTIVKSLEQAGVLDDQNVSELAQQLAQSLVKSSQSLSDDDNYETTLPTLTRAIADFFKSLGLNTKDFVETEQKILADVLGKL